MASTDKGWCEMDESDDPAMDYAGMIKLDVKLDGYWITLILGGIWRFGIHYLNQRPYKEIRGARLIIWLTINAGPFAVWVLR